MDETIVINGKNYTKEEIEQAIKAVRMVVETIKDGIVEMWERLKEIISRIAKQLAVKKCHVYNWYVPMNTTKLSQVAIMKPRIPHIRNHI